MDSAGILQLLEQLDDEIDDLEEALSPVLSSSLSSTLSKLPVLDKAKLYVLVTYAIESVLFSYLRLNGVKAREHPVFKELTRVKQYFDKIKNAELPTTIAKRDNLSLDKNAANRFITAALNGNDKYDLELAERQAKERARAHIKFTGLTRRQAAESSGSVAEANFSSESASSPSSVDLELKIAKPKKRKAEISSSGPESNVVPLKETDDSIELPVPKRKMNKGEEQKKKKKGKIQNTDGSKP